MADFPVNRSLLNPKFKGYRLSPLLEDQHTARFPLPSHPTQANVSGRTKVPLSLEEVQSRITHNHLSVGSNGDEVAFVDEEMRVVRVRLSQVRSFLFHRIQMSKPNHTLLVFGTRVHCSHRNTETRSESRDGLCGGSQGIPVLCVFAQ